MGRALRAVAALMLLVVLLAGIPALLTATIGNPLDGWADLKVGDLTDTVVVDLLAAVVWIAWAQFAMAVCFEAGAAVRHAPRPGHLPLVPHFNQQLAHTLIASLLLLGAAMTSLATPVQAIASPPPVSSSQSAMLGATVTAGVSAPAQSTLATTTFVVPADGQGPDTYWDIAATHCGGGEHWTQVWDLNRGRTQPDGTVMNDPGLLKPGWTVILPAPPPASTGTPAAATESVTVQPNDTLSGIAQQHGLSDWHQAWDASRGMAEPGGQSFDDPDLIRPGWTVQIPTTTVPSETPPAAPPETIPTPPSSPPPTTTAPNSPPTSPRPPPTTAVPSSPVAPVHQQPPTAQPATASDARSSELPMVAFAGGGTLLAGLSLAALIRYRRRQFRWRGAGRAIAATPPELIAVERQVLAAGGVGIADVTWLDQALRSLVHAQSRGDGALLPDVVAVRMTSDLIELVLTNPQPDPPAPWTADATATRWTVSRNDELTYEPADRPFHFAPFPTLVSVGHTATGDHWLLDLERVSAMSLSGDPERCLDLARFLAAELAHNSWSEMLHVTLVGFGTELATINPDRLTHTDDFASAITSLHHQLDSVREVLEATDVDVLTGRLRDVLGDAWAPHVLLIAPHLTDDTKGLDELLTAMRTQHARTAVALVLTGDSDHADGTRWQLTVDDHGALHIPALDLELIAQQIPADEAADLAQLLALAAITDDQPVASAGRNKPWDAYADAEGGLRNEISDRVPINAQAPMPDQYVRLVTASVAGAADIPTLRLADRSLETSQSVLPLPGEMYAERTTATTHDVETLAPRVTDDIRQRIEGADPDLDADLAAWRDLACTRPKVRLLGPVTVTAQGTLPAQSPRLSWNTEVVAYLATRPTGATAERFGTDLWPGEPDIAGKTKVRQAVMIVRKWLGETPDGREYLPKGTTSAANGGVARYEITDALVDAELFRRLRIRGLARGADGVEDLWLALDLVTGVPFDARRPGGYSWLVDEPLDHNFAGMVADTANTVSTRHLGACEPERAAAAAQVALRAGSSEDTPLLNLMLACDALGNRAEGDTYKSRIMANHDAEVEEDLPPRTFLILNRRDRLQAS